MEKREEYLSANKQYKLLLTITRDVGLNHPDGRASLQSAINLQRAALAAYSKALQIFNNLILNGKLPESWEDKPEG
jgi:hypothetical protein